MSDDHIQEPGAQPDPTGDTSIEEGALSDFAIGVAGGVAGNAAWDGIKATSRYLTSRVAADPYVLEPPAWINQGDEFIDSTVDGNWDQPIDFNAFDSA